MGLRKVFITLCERGGIGNLCRVTGRVVISGRRQDMTWGTRTQAEGKARLGEPDLRRKGKDLELRNAN